MPEIIIIGDGQSLLQAKALANELNLSFEEVVLERNASAEKIELLIARVGESSIHLAIDPYHLSLERSAILKILMARRLKLTSLVSKTARIHPSVRLGKNVQIGSDAVLNQGARVADGVFIGEGSVVHSYASLAKDTWVGNAVVVGRLSSIGAGTFIGDGASVAPESLIGSRCELAVAQHYSGSIPDHFHRIHASRGAVRFISNSALRESSNA